MWLVHDSIRRIKQFSDDQFVQLLMVQALVNSLIKYDNNEVKTGARRTLVATINDFQAVCEEQAQLKMALLKYLGFSAEQVRFLTEYMTSDGEQYKMNIDGVVVPADHAVNAVRLKSPEGTMVTVILSNSQTWISGERFTTYGAFSKIDAYSTVELDSAQANLMNTKDDDGHVIRYYPLSAYGFTRNLYGLFDVSKNRKPTHGKIGAVPRSVTKPYSLQSVLSPRKYEEAMKILKPALATRDQIVDADPPAAPMPTPVPSILQSRPKLVASPTQISKAIP